MKSPQREADEPRPATRTTGAIADSAARTTAYQFTPGSTLTVDGAPGNNVFSFDASGPSIVVALNGEIHTFAAGDFSNYVFNGSGGGSETAYLTCASSGANFATLNANGIGQLTNSSAGFTVSVSGMTSIHANGNAGDTAQFYDLPGNDTFYAYADYKSGGRTLAGMYGSGAPSGSGGYSNSASGFSTNLGYSVNGGSDTADLAASTGNNSLYTDAAIAQLYGRNYSEEVSGFDVVNVNVDEGAKIKGPMPANYQLNFVGGWDGA